MSFPLDIHQYLLMKCLATDRYHVEIQEEQNKSLCEGIIFNILYFYLVWVLFNIWVETENLHTHNIKEMTEFTQPLNPEITLHKDKF